MTASGQVSSFAPSRVLVVEVDVEFHFTVALRAGLLLRGGRGGGMALLRHCGVTHGDRDR